MAKSEGYNRCSRGHPYTTYVDIKKVVKVEDAQVQKTHARRIEILNVIKQVKVA